MAENDQNNAPAESQDQVQLQGGTYEIIRNRLKGHSKELLQRMQKLNDARKDVFGAVESKLLSSKRISTRNNCVPRDVVPIGDKFIFGYNVFVGLRTETTLEDVFLECLRHRLAPGVDELTQARQAIGDPSRSRFSGLRVGFHGTRLALRGWGPDGKTNLT